MPRRQAAELDAAKRDDLNTDQFAYIAPDGSKHLPINDAPHVRAALARFDQTDFADADCKARAARKIVAAAKRMGIDVSDDSAVCKAMAEPEPGHDTLTHSHMHCHTADDGSVYEHEHDHYHEHGSPDDHEHLMPDAKAASQPSVSGVHVNAPLKKVSVAYRNGESDDDEPDDEDTDDANDDSEDEGDARKRRKKVDPTGGDDQGEGQETRAAERPTRAFLTKLRELLTPKVAATDLDAAIRGARAHAGGKGKSAASAMRRMAGEDVSDLCARGAGYRLFLELRRTAEAPDWIPFLPKPGVYTHPQWGKIAVTRERSRQFIENFRAKVYQEHIPLDAEHQTKLSGAFAYLRDLRMNEDGSVDARVEWTDRGKALVEAGQFRYFSPEWFDRWVEPASGKEHRNLIVGGAFTTRPFFKDASLRPLVAREGAIDVVERATVPDDPEAPYVAAVYTAERSANAGVKGNGMPDQATTTGAEAGEPTRRFAEFEAKLAAEQAARQATETALKQASEKIAAMEQQARRKRFTDEVLGKGEASAARWFGEPDKHVTLMEKLADTFGEDSAEVRQYVEQNRATAEIVAQSGLFREIGSDAGGPNGGPEAQLDAHAKQYQEKHPDLTFEQAYSRVFAEHPELQRQIAGRGR